MRFFRKRKKRPLNFIEVKEKSGVLIKSSEHGCLWIVSPFWDVSTPVIINAPDRNIDAVIVINNHICGCLPFSSFLAVDKDIPLDKIYVTDIKNYADWHPNYKDQKGVSSLIDPIELPETKFFGNLKVSYNKLNDFVEVTQKEDFNRFSYKVFIGLNLFHSSKGIMIKNLRDEIKDEKYYFIGNLDNNNLKETITFFTNVAIARGPNNINVIMFKDWIYENSNDITEFCNHMGIDIISIGKSDINQ